ncbi:MAG: hypothetical protein ACTH31_04705 [Pseudoclavibacter sp.]
MPRLLGLVALITAVAVIVVGVVVLAAPFSYTWTTYTASYEPISEFSVVPYPLLRHILGLIAVGVGAAVAGGVLGFWLGRRRPRLASGEREACPPAPF